MGSCFEVFRTICLKIPRKSLEFLLLSFVSTESCVGDKRGKRSKHERQTG